MARAEIAYRLSVPLGVIVFTVLLLFYQNLNREKMCMVD